MNRWCVLVSSLAFAVVGCGGEGGGEDTSGKSRMTRAEYVVAADRICKQVNTEVADRQAEWDRVRQRAQSAQETYEGAADLFGDAYASQRVALRELTDLEPPADDAATVGRLVEMYDQQVALLGRMRDAAQRQDGKTLQALSGDIQRVATRSKGLARGFGFKECGTE